MDIVNLIPAWFVGINLIAAGFMWLVTRKTRIRMDSRIWGNTFVMLGLLYIASYASPNPATIITMEERVLRLRFFLCLIAFSQWFPLTVSYFRHLYHSRKVIDGLVRNINNINGGS